MTAQREHKSSAKAKENTTDHRANAALNQIAGGLRFRQCDMPASVSFVAKQYSGRLAGSKLNLHKETAPAGACWGHLLGHRAAMRSGDALCKRASTRVVPDNLLPIEPKSLDLRLLVAGQPQRL
jgi:hypothetical protein